MTNAALRAVRGLSMVAVIAWAGCSTPTPRAPERRLQNLGPPALHAVESRQLRKVMDELRVTVFEQFPTELDLDRSRAARAAELARAAHELSGAAAKLVETAPSLDLGDAERRVFTDLATKLGHQAGEVEELARTGRITEISPALDRMVATCNACHTSFRVFQPGDLDGDGVVEQEGRR